MKNPKKAAALLLAAVMLLPSCAAGDIDSSGSAIKASATSSAAADFLEERIDAFPDAKFVLGTEADAGEYGIDMTDFADDGYLIRADRGSVLLLGKTEVGLDRAVREFVKHGNSDDFKKTYNEGFRVKKLTVAGNDISEYAVVRDDSADECHVFASSELVKYVYKTCGATLSEFTESEYEAAADKPAHFIKLTVDYPRLGDEAFEVSVGGDGNLTIYGGRYRGCLFGVYGLLYDLGWRFTGSGEYGKKGFFSVVTGTEEYLYESEHVDLTPDINRTESPAICGRDSVTGELRNFDSYSVNNNYALGGYGLLDRMCHGMAVNHHAIFSGEYENLYLGHDKSGKQPCYTSEDIYEAVESWALRETASRLERYPEGECPPIDISQWDDFADSFCSCETCLQVVGEEVSLCGPVLRMANRLAEKLNSVYDGIKVNILAYAGLETLPKLTKPNKDIVVSFCVYVGSCQNHTFDDPDCPRNTVFREKFEDWMMYVAPYQTVVWYYPFTTYANAFHSPFYTVFLDDMKYFSQYKIGHFFICADNSNTGVTNDQLGAYLCSKFMWNCDYTEEEMLGLIREWLDIIYGDAGSYIYEYLMYCEEAADRTGCWTSFFARSVDKVDNISMAVAFDYFCDLFEEAKKAADTSVIEELVERCKAGMLYICVGITYEDRYVNGTAEERAVIAERYTEAYNIFKKYHIPVYDGLLNQLGYVPDTLNLDKSPFDDWRYVEKWW